MPNPVVHWEIIGKDVKRLWSFYHGLFDCKIEGDNPMNYGFVDTTSRTGINGAIGQTDGPSRVTIFVEVGDPAASLQKVEELGGKTVMPLTKMSDKVTIAIFADPEGNVVGLLKG